MNPPTIPSAAPAGSAALPLQLQFGGTLRITVPASLSAITTYVLLEQEDWFEKEIRFVRRFIRPGMSAIDIGANLGIYSLTLAQLAGPSGHVFAYEPGREARNFLERSRDLNKLDNLHVSGAAVSDSPRDGYLEDAASSELRKLSTSGAGDAIHITSIDVECEARKFPPIDFVKIDAEGEEENILNGGRAFFADQSPLVLFEVDSTGDAGAPIRAMFQAMGYGIYRQLWGEPILIPYDASQPHDSYEFNLFAAKPDRAATLAERDLLAQLPQRWTRRMRDEKDATAFWRQFKYIRTLKLLPKSGLSSDPVYHEGLVAYAVWRNSGAPMEMRCAALAFALEAVREACRRSASPERLATLARVAWEWGERRECVQALEELLRVLGTTRFDFKEPFCLPNPRFDTTVPLAAPADWLAVAAAEHLEKVVSYSSLFGGVTRFLPWLCSQPIAATECERRRVLVAARGEQHPTVPERLRQPAPDHVLSNIWASGQVPGTVL